VLFLFEDFTLDGKRRELRNHLFVESEPAWKKFIGEIKAFLAT
jgi:hypothetical protein